MKRIILIGILMVTALTMWAVPVRPGMWKVVTFWSGLVYELTITLKASAEEGGFILTYSPPTGIREMVDEKSKKEGSVYDLQEKKVKRDNMPRGLYIINNRKMFIK